jgi:hypothetical protein
MMTIEQLHAEGRLIRGKWSDTDAQGRELLCLYTALAGDADARPGTCPADMCPLWLAHLIPWINDAGTAAHWPSVVDRFARLAPRLGEIQGDRSARLDYRCRAIAVREARSHVAGGHAALGVIDGVLALLDRASAGAPVTADEWARAEAWAAAAETRAARAAETRAAWAAEAAAARAAEAAAWAAAAAAAWSAWAAWAAAAAAADRIIDAILDAIEAELSNENAPSEGGDTP